MKIGDHVAHDHKGRRAFGIIREVVPGIFGELRARVEWVSGHGSPFPVCVEDISPDTAGVVTGTLKARTFYR